MKFGLCNKTQGLSFLSSLKETWHTPYRRQAWAGGEQTASWLVHARGRKGLGHLFLKRQVTHLRISCLKTDFCQLTACWCLVPQGSLMLLPPSALAWGVWMTDTGPHRSSLSPLPSPHLPFCLYSLRSPLSVRSSRWDCA